MFHRKQNSNDEHQAMKIHKAVHRMPLKKTKFMFIQNFHVITTKYRE